MTHPAQPPPLKVRNFRTRALNRRESFWQIVLPLALAIIVVLTLMALIIVGTIAGSIASAQDSAFADVSLIFLILMAGAGGALVLALVVGLCVGFWFALRELPYLFKRAQDFMALVAYHTKRVTAPLNESVLSVGSLAAAVRQAVASVRSLFAPGR